MLGPFYSYGRRSGFTPVQFPLFQLFGEWFSRWQISLCISAFQINNSFQKYFKCMFYSECQSRDKCKKLRFNTMHRVKDLIRSVCWWMHHFNCQRLIQMLNTIDDLFRWLLFLRMHTQGLFIYQHWICTGFYSFAESIYFKGVLWTSTFVLEGSSQHSWGTIQPRDACLTAVSRILENLLFFF